MHSGMLQMAVKQGNCISIIFILKHDKIEYNLKNRFVKLY